MKNQKGVTLFTVILTVIVALLIASTSIIVGNKLILSAREKKQQENYEAVVAAVNREIAKINSGGVISPGIHTYIGIQNPVVGRDASGNAIQAGEDWYLLEPSHLAQLGVEELEDSYLVNYKLGVVIDMKRVNDLPAELAKYKE